MTPIESECHFLLIEEEHGNRSIHLTSMTYSLGRSSKNAIVLPSTAISREHALLLRMPSREPGKYTFRLLDGNASGKPSLNGFTVNGDNCSVRDLEHGDQIVFGGKIRASYEVRPAHILTEEDEVATQVGVPLEDLHTQLA